MISTVFKTLTRAYASLSAELLLLCSAERGVLTVGLLLFDSDLFISVVVDIILILLPCCGHLLRLWAA